MNTLNITNEMELNFALGIISLLYQRGLITLNESFIIKDDIKDKYNKLLESNEELLK